MINFVYYFKKNHKVYKNIMSYYDLQDLLDMTRKKDSKGELFTEGHTYQLMQCKDFLLSNKELKIFKCNVFVNTELLPI